MVTLIRMRPQVPEDPSAEANLRRERQAERERWEQAVDRRAQVEEELRRIDGEWVPQLEGHVAEAEGAWESARWRLLQRVIQQQGGQALEVEGLPAVVLEPGEEEKDPDSLAARAHLDRLRQGLARLRERRELLVRVLQLADGPAPGA